MSDNLFLNHYRITSARARWHHYNAGIYFVTVCTHNRIHYFGEIVETWRATSLQTNQQQINNLSVIGKYLDKQILDIQTHYPYAQIPVWVVMPNHFHAIVVIDGQKIPAKTRRTKTIVETWRAASLQYNEIANMQGWLSVVIGGLKSSVTRFANENKISFSWQPRFHDHIIRDNDELNRITEYIDNNVANWCKP